MTTSARTDATDRWLDQIDLPLPRPPQPFGTHVMAVQTGNLLFLSGMLPTVGREVRFTGRLGADLEVDDGRKAARLAALNTLAVAREHLGTLDRIERVVRLSVFLATTDDFRDHPDVADGASELLLWVLGPNSTPCRQVIGTATLPLGVPVLLEAIIEVGG